MPPGVGVPQLGLHPDMTMLGPSWGDAQVVKGNVQLEQGLRNLQQVRFGLLKKEILIFNTE